MDEDEDLAIEFLLGTPGPRGRTYLDPDSERGKRARTILARKLREEAPDGYFTQIVAKLIDPPRRSAIFQREIVFKRPRGTPVIMDARRDPEIAALMRVLLAQLAKRKRGAAMTAAEIRNFKDIIDAAQKKFGVKRSTVMSAWSKFRPPKKSKNSGRSPNK
jgi:hypothetical protein